MFKDRRINLLIGLGLCVSVIVLLMFNFTTTTVVTSIAFGETRTTTTFNGFTSITMLFQFDNLAQTMPEIFWMAVISLIAIGLALCILVFIAIYSMYKKTWMLVVYNILIQLLFLCALAFMAPFIIAEDRAFQANNRDAYISTSVYAAQIILWSFALVGGFMATLLSYKNKIMLFLLYFAGGIGFLIIPIMIIFFSKNDKRIQQLEQQLENSGNPIN
ncbi:MAG: hypothetical protein FWE16_04445 [Firmicutes bacterium]|nr:hypothetical protein [Bacillota bacterium]